MCTPSFRQDSKLFDKSGCISVPHENFTPSVFVSLGNAASSVKEDMVFVQYLMDMKA